MNENEVEYRTAATLGVDYEQRVIEVLAVPYNEIAEVQRRGRLVSESIDPEAFVGAKGGVTTDITVNRAHDLEQVLGRVHDLHPGDPRGCVLS